MIGIAFVIGCLVILVGCAVWNGGNPKYTNNAIGGANGGNRDVGSFDNRNGGK